MSKKKTPAAPTLADLILAAANLIEQAANLGAQRGYGHAIGVLELAIASDETDESRSAALRQALAILKAEVVHD